MKLLEWNYKISQTESFCSHDYFSRPFKEEDIWITSVSFSKRVGSCPRVQAASAVGNPFPEDSHWTWEGWRGMEKLLPGRAGPSQDLRAGQEMISLIPLFLLLQDTKLQIRLQGLNSWFSPWDHFPRDQMPLQDPGNAGEQNPRRLQGLQTSPEWFLLAHLDPGPGKSMDNSKPGSHPTPEPFPGTVLGDSLCTWSPLFVFLCASLVLWFYFCVRERKRDFYFFV